MEIQYYIAWASIILPALGWVIALFNMSQNYKSTTLHRIALAIFITGAIVGLFGLIAPLFNIY